MSVKRKGFLFVLVSVLLFLCLACLEIPEMSTLTDDVSNDFTILPHNAGATEMVVSARETEVAPRHHTLGCRHESPAFGFAAPIFLPGARDLLALHSLRRT